MRQAFHETATVVAVHANHVDVIVGGRSSVYRGIPIVGGTDDVRVGDRVSLEERDGEIYAESTRSHMGKRAISKLAVTGMSPPGSDHSVVYNNDGAWGGASNLKWDNDNDELEVTGDVIVSDEGRFGAKWITIGDETVDPSGEWPNNDTTGIVFYDPTGTGGDVHMWVDFDDKSLLWGIRDESFTQSSEDVVIGFNAASNMNKTGSDGCVIIGHWAVYGSSGYIGTGNVVLGMGAGYELTSGSRNMIQGNYSGFYLEEGSSNIVIGYQALFSNQTADVERNVIIGTQAASTTGSDEPNGCVLIGYQAGKGAGAITRQLRIENQNSTSYTKPLIYGEFDASTGDDQPPFVAINYDDRKADATTFITRAISGAVHNQWEMWGYQNDSYASLAIGYYDFGDDSNSDYWLLSRRYGSSPYEDGISGGGDNHRCLAIYNRTSGGGWNLHSYFSKKDSDNSFSAMDCISQCLSMSQYQHGSNANGCEYVPGDCNCVPFGHTLPIKCDPMIIERVVYAVYTDGTHNASNRFKWRLYAYDINAGSSTLLAGWTYSSDAAFSTTWARKSISIQTQIDNSSGKHTMIFMYMEKEGTPGQIRFMTPYVYIRFPA